MAPMETEKPTKMQPRTLKPLSWQGRPPLTESLGISTCLPFEPSDFLSAAQATRSEWDQPSHL